MTANEEVISEAKNGEKDVQESEDTKEQKVNLEAKNIESLSMNEQEPIKEKDESQSTEQQKSDGNESNKAKKRKKNNGTPPDMNLLIRIRGFPRFQNETEELKLYHAFFTQEMGINAPSVETSSRIDDWVIFKLKAEEDRKTLFSKFKKGKLYSWRIYKLDLKLMPTELLGKEFQGLSLNKALQILFPYKDITYGKQLKEKTKTSREVIDSILPKEANIKMKPIVPMICIDGYDYHVPLSIEEQSETKRTICGIRVMTADKKRACIVPIEQCPNVPHQISLVAKDFVDNMPEFGFTPFGQNKKEGNILGIILQMTQLCNFIMTIVVPITKLEQFKQLTENGTEGDTVTAHYFSEIDETKESIIEKAAKYFKNRGKDNGILSVYLSIVSPKSGFSWIGDNALAEAHHILGDSTIPGYYNGQQIQVMWTKDYFINNSLVSILNVIQEWDYINSSSSVFLVCNHQIVALYLANKVENIRLLCTSKKGNLVTMKAWAKKMGLDKILFFNHRSKRKKFLIGCNTNTALIWHTINKSVVNCLVDSGITKVIFVSYWTKDPPEMFSLACKESLKYASDKLEIVNIFPIDIAPYTDRFCLLIFLHVRNITRKRSSDSVERRSPNEAECSYAKRLKMTQL